MSKWSDPAESLIFTMRLITMPTWVLEGCRGAQGWDCVHGKALLEMSSEMMTPKEVCFLVSLQFPPCCRERTLGMSQGHGDTWCGCDCPRHFRYVATNLLNQQASMRIGIIKVAHTHCGKFRVCRQARSLPLCHCLSLCFHLRCD